ncbi:MAG TPA: hypothetical protein V6D47_11385 [Oscillatoriaceae cyanobacterium]
MPLNTPEEKKRFIDAFTRKARRNLREAAAALIVVENGDALLSEERYKSAATRAYYALYQAANAWMAYKGGYPNIEQRRNNWSHESVAESWGKILVEIHDDFGVESEYDGDRLFMVLKTLRVKIDYGVSTAPSLQDVKIAVETSQRATGWILKALERADEKVSARGHAR